MVSQLESIMSSERQRYSLIRWLTHNTGESERQKLEEALDNYPDHKYRVVGVLVRDADPQERDLSSSCSKLRKRAATGELLALYALYLPVGIKQAGQLARSRG